MRRVSVIAGAALLLVVISKLVIEDLLGIDLMVVVSGMSEASPVTAVLVVGLLAADIGVPVPSSVVMVLSGALFGGLVGGALSFAGAMTGAWIGYELARRFGRPLAERLAGAATLDDLQNVFVQHGIGVVVVTRALPIAMEGASFVAGLSGMRRGSFLLACAIGTAPVAWLYAYSGALSRRSGSLLPAVVMLVAFAVGWLLTRGRLRRRTGIGASSGPGQADI